MITHRSSGGERLRGSTWWSEERRGDLDRLRECMDMEGESAGAAECERGPSCASVVRGGWYDAGLSRAAMCAARRLPCGDMSLRERRWLPRPRSPITMPMSGGGLVDEPTLLMEAPSATRRSRPSSKSHSDVSESDRRDAVLGGPAWPSGLRWSDGDSTALGADR